MPRFIFDFGTEEAEKVFKGLNEFTRGYIECMFWVCSGREEDDFDHATFADLSPEALDEIVADCDSFLSCLEPDEDDRTLLDQAIECAPSGYSMGQAGNDFYLTRNRHGAGFWDRGLGQIGDDLTIWAHSFSTVETYVGDDGLIYIN
jgi:hypothetical protein